MRDDTTLGGIARRRLRGTVTACLSLTLVLAAGSAARAQFDVETKLTASDGAAHDIFGSSVAISGNTAIVGAHFDGDAGQWSGSAYLFDVTTGNQLFKLTASDAASFDEFGISVGISGNTAIVGAHGESRSGAAYLFDVTTGNELIKLTAPDGGSFGVSVGISGNTVIVGAHADNDAGNASGSAYLFDLATGNQLFKLTASDAAEFDRFGGAVGVSGNTAIVGASGNDDAGNVSGSAYLFDVTTGIQLFKLTASDAGAADRFGQTVGIHGNTAIVGAWTDSSPFANDHGSAYLFDVTTGKQLFKLTASDAASFDAFGVSVGISGNTAIVGASDDDDDGSGSGSAYVFDVTTGEQLLKLTASDATELDAFGFSVGVSGNTAIVGARFDRVAGIRGAGSAYLFTSASPLSDLTGNGFVDFEDLTVLLANWNKEVGADAGNLVNAETTPVNFEDLTVLLADWTGPGPAGSPEAALGSEAVPEPSTFVLLVIATPGLSFYRRRKRRRVA